MDPNANATYLNCGVTALFNSISPDWFKTCEQITSLTFPHHCDGTGLAAYLLLISHRSITNQRAGEGRGLREGAEPVALPACFRSSSIKIPNRRQINDNGNDAD